MKYETPPMPTSEQCSTNYKFKWKDLDCFATYRYPQMGGYCAKSVVVLTSNDCFDVYIWHDGEFPFHDKPPVELHHCDAEQFIAFGNLVLRRGEKE